MRVQVEILSRASFVGTSKDVVKEKISLWEVSVLSFTKFASNIKQI